MRICIANKSIVGYILFICEFLFTHLFSHPNRLFIRVLQTGNIYGHRVRISIGTIVWDRNKAKNIGKWSICGGGRLERFCCSSMVVETFTRVYQHIEMLGLFLFNDSLVVTRRTTRHFPFERATELNYRFETCAPLNRLRLDDIPDSKCKFKGPARVCCPLEVGCLLLLLCEYIIDVIIYKLMCLMENSGLSQRVLDSN